MDTIKVSIITVCYNSEATIERTIRSVIDQTYKNWEYVIIDGGSTDSTMQLIRRYEKQYTDHFRVYQGSDEGIYDAMNKGISYANGEIIGIINSDDWYEVDAIENVVNTYISHPGNMKVVTGGLNRVRDGIIIYSKMHSEITLKALKKGMPLQHPAVFVSKTIYDRIGVFDLSYQYIADYDFIWRCYMDDRVDFLFINAVVSNMSEGGVSDVLSWYPIWRRTIERFRLRSKYISKIESFRSSCFFLIRELFFQSAKRVLNARKIQKLYMLKNRKNTIFSVMDRILKKTPHLRKILVYLYHFIRYLVIGTVRRIGRYKTGFLTEGTRITPVNRNCFFGYYDKTPFSSDGSHYLYHMIKGKSSPQVGEVSYICYASSVDNYEIVGQTLAWNLQQGSMLRFINDNLISWNDFDRLEKKYVSIIYDVCKKRKRIYDFPLYDVSDDGRRGLSMDFERLNIDAEGYGYIQLQSRNFDSDTYIRIVDLNTGESEEIITLDYLNSLYPIPREASFAYFNHLEFNPSANRFIFILRYLIDQKRISRLFSSDIEGKDIRLLADDGIVSHCTWMDDTHITLWCSLGGKLGYYTITDTKKVQSSVLGYNAPKVDGHPSYNKDCTLMVTDTYPDIAEYRHLIIYDVVRDKCTDIARLYSPILLHGPLRCDLHPRWTPRANQVVIDSAHEGFRGMYLVKTE